MKTKKWDAAEYIKTKEDVIAYLEYAIEQNDMECLLSTLGNIVRSKGMSKIARELQLNRAGLYKSLSESGNPSFATVIRILDIIGFSIELKPKQYKKAS